MQFTQYLSLILFTICTFAIHASSAGLERRKPLRIEQKRDTILGEALGLVGGVLSNADVGHKLPIGVQCTSSHREQILSLVKLGYGANTLLEGQEFFRAIPFAQDCKAEIAPDGLPLIPFTVDRRTTLLLTLYTAAVIDHITPTYRSFHNNFTSVIDAEVHLGVEGIDDLSVSFQAAVFFDFDGSTCEIKKVRAFARIPSKVLGHCINLPGLPLQSILSDYLFTHGLL